MGAGGGDDKYANVPYFIALETYMNYIVLMIFGYVADWVLTVVRGGVHGLQKPGYAPIVKDFDDFFTRRLYSRLKDCWARPICSAPGAQVDVMERQDNVAKDWRNELELTGGVLRCINLASYNYLGYGELPGGVEHETIDALHNAGVSTGGNGVESRSELQERLEKRVAEFLGKEAALVMGMGYATNAQIISAIVGEGSLIISDTLNHASIIVGARSSGARIRTFDHNNAESLEEELRDAVANGQPGSGAPWRKILVVVEGIYSMEGEICKLPEIVRVKKRYGAYLFLDEAHSVGALGRTGRGVCEYWGVPTRDVDVLMGTFTKSFGAIGGYIASSHELIRLVRYTAPGVLYSSPMSPPCAQHVLWVMSQITGEDGTGEGRRRIEQLRRNTVYLRRRLSALGVQIYGQEASPVIPLMIYGVGKLAAFSRECLARGLAVVVVGFPATPLILSRARICVSAAHSREDLDRAVQVLDEVCTLSMVKYNLGSVRRRRMLTAGSGDGGGEARGPGRGVAAAAVTGLEAASSSVAEAVDASVERKVKEDESGAGEATAAAVAAAANTAAAAALRVPSCGLAFGGGAELGNGHCLLDGARPAGKLFHL